MEFNEAICKRGQTYTGIPNQSTAASSDGRDQEGLEKLFRDDDLNQQPPAHRSNRSVRCRMVRNYTSGSLTSATGSIALLPKRLVQLDSSFLFQRATGYATVSAGRCFPVDEFLPAAGVLNWDLFWVVVNGPALVLTGLAFDAGNVINAGDCLSSLTAATSQATSSGRIKTADWTGATAVLGAELAHIIGTALSASTTSQTTASTAGILVDVGQP